MTSERTYSNSASALFRESSAGCGTSVLRKHRSNRGRGERPDGVGVLAVSREGLAHVLRRALDEPDAFGSQRVGERGRRGFAPVGEHSRRGRYPPARYLGTTRRVRRPEARTPARGSSRAAGGSATTARCAIWPWGRAGRTRVRGPAFAPPPPGFWRRREPRRPLTAPGSTRSSPRRRPPCRPRTICPFGWTTARSTR